MQIVSLLLAVFAVILLWVFLFQERMVYYPSPDMAGTPADAGMFYEDVVLTAADGTELAAWWVPADEPRGTVLFCHGNAGNISHRLETLAVLHGMRFSVLIFDYRGYGRSQGKPSEEGTYQDAEAAWGHLVVDKGLSPEAIAVMGRSLGGGVASWLAEKKNPAALLLESTFTSVPDMGKTVYPWLPRILARIRYDTLSRMATLQCPLLVAHSPQDEVVPFEFGRAIYEAFGGTKHFLTMTGGHNDGFLKTGARYVEELDSFLTHQAGFDN